MVFHPWAMDANESESKFDALTSTETLYIQGNSLNRVPSLKNMGNLVFLTLAFNKITEIVRGLLLFGRRLACVGGL